MTFLEIEQDVYRRLQKNVTAPDSVVKARIDTFINDNYRQLMREYGLGPALREETITFASEDGQQRYALPVNASQILSITDTTNRIKLQERSLAWIREQDPSQPAQVTGTPWVYAVLNEAGIQRQPTVFGNGALRLISSDGTDVMPITIEYSMPNGGFQVASVNLTGTFPVVVPIAAQYIFRIYTTVAPVGTVELFQSAPAITIARIPGSQTNTATLHAWVVHLWPTPNGVIQYIVDISRPRRALINATDEPALPEEFHTLLVYGACRDECVTMDDTRADYYKEKWDADVRKLRAFLNRADGQAWIPRGRARGWSDLGPYFPADRGGFW